MAHLHLGKLRLIEVEVQGHQNLCASKYTIYLNLNAFPLKKLARQAVCPSGGERINKLWSTQRMEYYSAKKK